MACFRLLVGFKTFTFSTRGDLSGTSQDLINVLSEYAQSDDAEKINTLVEFKNALQDIPLNTISEDSVLDRNFRELQVYDNPNFLYVVKNNLELYGIKMNIVNDAKIKELLGMKNVDNIKAFVYNGEIYVREGSVNITDPLHELSHLLFGVMKIQSPRTYVELMLTMSLHPQIKEILEEIKESPVYNSKLESDLYEEATVRLIEMMLTDGDIEDTFTINGLDINVVDLLNKHLQPVVSTTLGVTKYPGFLTFFKSLVKKVPVFGSLIFVPRKLNSTGFKSYRLQAIRSLQVSEYINLLVENKQIKIVNCE